MRRVVARFNKLSKYIRESHASQTEVAASQATVSLFCTADGAVAASGLLAFMIHLSLTRLQVESRHRQTAVKAPKEALSGFFPRVAPGLPVAENGALGGFGRGNRS